MAIQVKLSRYHQAITTALLMVTALFPLEQGATSAQPAASVQAQLLNVRPIFSTRNTPTTPVALLQWLLALAAIPAPIEFIYSA